MNADLLITAVSPSALQGLSSTPPLGIALQVPIPIPHRRRYPQVKFTFCAGTLPIFKSSGFTYILNIDIYRRHRSRPLRTPVRMSSPSIPLQSQGSPPGPPASSASPSASPQNTSDSAANATLYRECLAQHRAFSRILTLTGSCSLTPIPGHLRFPSLVHLYNGSSTIWQPDSMHHTILATLCN